MNKKPQFINLDFELFFNKKPLYLLKNLAEEYISILYSGENNLGEEHSHAKYNYLVSLEMNAITLTSIIKDFYKLINNLDNQAKDDWLELKSLILDIGFYVPKESKTNCIQIPKGCIEIAEKFGAHIVITTYQKHEEDWDYSHEEDQLKLQLELDLEVEN